MIENLTLRPSPCSKGVNAAVAKKLAPAIAAWMEDGASAVDVEPDLVKTLSIRSDGYELAKALEERCGYSPDAQLVEILNRVGSLRQIECDRLQEAWVKARGFTVPAIGARVAFTLDDQDCEGEVLSNSAAGTSLVFCPALGHVREGLGSHGRYFPWEQLKEAAHA